MPKKQKSQKNSHKQHGKINKVDMDKVKIKRAKRSHKKTTTKEKALAALGLGSTLIGGVGAVSPKSSQTQFVRSQDQQAGSTTSKVKETLGKIFGSTFGAKKAKAATMEEIQAQMASGNTTNEQAYVDYLQSVSGATSQAAQAELEAEYKEEHPEYYTTPTTPTTPTTQQPASQPPPSTQPPPSATVDLNAMDQQRNAAISEAQTSSDQRQTDLETWRSQAEADAYNIENETERDIRLNEIQ